MKQQGPRVFNGDWITVAWADARTDPFTIAAILGHSTIQMSARYTHATDERKRRAVENMSRSQKSGHIPVTQLEAAG